MWVYPLCKPSLLIAAHSMHNVALWKIANHLFADSYIFETMSRPGPVAICWSEKHLNLCMELARALQSTGGPSGKCGRSIENAFQSAQQSRAQAHANWAVRLQLSRLHINIATLDTSGRKKGPACPVLINIWSERSRPPWWAKEKSLIATGDIRSEDMKFDYFFQKW